MPVSLRHGGQGSYKTAYAVWHNLLPQLRAGRVCVTNVKELKSLEDIEAAMGEKFPDSAKLIRIETITPEAIQYMAEWFCWAPFGAFILIDEVAKIYPKKESEFKKIIKEVYDHPVEYWENTLPDGSIDRVEKIRPPKLTIAFDEHRHYGWDVCLTCVNKDFIYEHVLKCIEWCYHHRQLDTVGIAGFYPYKRRPRIIQHYNWHSPSPANSFKTTREFIPLKVHDLYTSTLAVYANATSKNLMAGQLTKVYWLLGIGAAIYLGATYLLPVFMGVPITHKTDVSATKASSTAQNPKAASPSSSVSASLNADPNDGHKPADPIIPFGLSEVYIMGTYQSEADQQLHKMPLVLFTGYYSDGKQVDFYSRDLYPLGYTVQLNHSCGAVIKKGSAEFLVRCRPEGVKSVVKQDSVSPQPIL